MFRAALLLACTAIVGQHCSGCDRPSSWASPVSSTNVSSAEVPAPPDPVRTEEVAVPGDLPAVVVRGARAHRLKMVFVPGMCVHPTGYVTSFQQTAASRGDLVAVQGDVSCGGDGSARRWSNDLEEMDRRIDAAFVASGLGEPREIVVIGYSQGAERAERLVARWPEKYSSAILIGSPVQPSKANLSRADAVVLMAGTLDAHAKAQSKSALPSLEKVVPVTFLEIPGARHGAMGEDPERTMAEALDFVEERLGTLDSAPAPSNR